MLSGTFVRTLVVSTLFAVLAIAVPAASASDLLSTTVSTDGAKFRRCHDQLAPGAAGVTTRRATVTDAGLIGARLRGSDAAD